MPLEPLCRQITQWKQSSMTTNIVEQNHGSGAVIAKYHPELSGDVLVGRSTLHAGLALFRPSAEEKAAQRIERRIARVEQKRPYRVNGRAMFFKALVAGLVEDYEATPFDGFDSAGTRPSMMRHVELYNKLPLAAKEAFDLDAREHAQRKEAEHIEEIRKQEDELSELRQEYRNNESRYGAPNHMISFRFPSSDFDRMYEMFDEARFAPQPVSDLRASVLDPPLAPGDEYMKLLDDIVDEMPGKPQPRTAVWCQVLCRNRKHIQHLAFRLEEDDDVVYKVLYAYRNPLHCVFLRLHSGVRPLPDLDSLTGDDVANFDTLYPLHRFSHRPTTFTSGRHLRDDAEVSVLRNVMWNGHEFGTSQIEEPFERVIARFRVGER